MLAPSGIHHTSNVIACIDPTCALLQTVQPQPRPRAQRNTHGPQKLKATWADRSRGAPIDVRRRWSAKLSHSHSQHDSVGHKQTKTLQITFVNIQARHNTENAAMDETRGAALRNEPEKKTVTAIALHTISDARSAVCSAAGACKSTIHARASQIASILVDIR